MGVIIQDKMAQIKEQSRFYKIKMLRTRAKNGLLMYTVRNTLTRIGLDLDPFWLEMESLKFCDEPTLKDQKELYTLRKIDDSVIIEQYQTLSWNTEELKKVLASDHYSFGLYRNDQIAALMFACINQYTFKNQQFVLGANEAYLGNMYTYEHFRGKNLAPYLRYKCYEMLAKEGKTTCYSITQYFNTSSLKFKAKLGVQHQALYLHLGLFKRLGRTFKLRTYKIS